MPGRGAEDAGKRVDARPHVYSVFFAGADLARGVMMLDLGNDTSSLPISEPRAATA
jgi:hypothetical protein